MLKVHPPHQLLYPNAYRDNLPQQAQIYERAQALGLPVMFHTGTSIFPKARNKFAQPIHIDDLLVDFPKLKIILAHGGRPLWMDEALFLLRRSKNVFLDISSIPPQSLLKYFPRLDQLADQTMFGSDWPGPGVKDIGANLEKFRALPISEETKRKILRETALRVFGG
jgi:predicted TIM-barrel fold metal-dependent hydrolase